MKTIEKFSVTTISKALDNLGKGKGAIQSMLHSATFAAFNDNVEPINALYNALADSTIGQTEIVKVAQWMHLYAPVYRDKESGTFKVSTNKVKAVSVVDANSYWAWAVDVGAITPYFEDRAAKEKAEKVFTPDTLDKMLSTIIAASVKGGFDESAALISKIKSEVVAAAKMKAEGYALNA